MRYSIDCNNNGDVYHSNGYIEQINNLKTNKMVYILVMLTVMWIFRTIVFTWESNSRNKKARKRFLQELKRK